MTLPSQAACPAIPPAQAATVLPQIADRQSLLKAHMDLCKVRLNGMVVFTTALGFIVGTQQMYPPNLHWLTLLWTCLGTFLAAAGASAFNQAIEAPRDARMHRTRKRPLCTGRLTRTYAATLGLILCITGVAILCPTANGLTACLAAANVLIYVLIYTPLKPLSTVNTLVGAIVGGIPPVLGWTAATNVVTPGALVLGAILFVWQIPHFLALCWMYREDYARGGFKMLPIVDRTGRLTANLALLYAVLLMPLCLLVAYFGNAGEWFVGVSFVLTIGLIAVAFRFAASRSNPDARRLFFASIIYLPILSATLMLDARGPLSDFERTPAGYFRSDQPAREFQDPEAMQNVAAPQPTAETPPAK